MGKIIRGYNCVSLQHYSIRINRHWHELIVVTKEEYSLWSSDINWYRKKKLVFKEYPLLEHFESIVHWNCIRIYHVFVIVWWHPTLLHCKSVVWSQLEYTLIQLTDIANTTKTNAVGFVYMCLFTFIRMCTFNAGKMICMKL